MGKEFVPQDQTPASPTGCYEDMDFVGFNHRILMRKGTLHPKIVVPPRPLEPLSFTWRDGYELQSLLDGKILDNYANEWGWKDMRTCFLLDLYAPHFDRLDAHFIVTYRSLDHAARSWLKLKQCSYETSLLTMAGYAGRLAQFLFENADLWPVLHLNFDDWFDDFDSQLDKLQGFVGRDLDSSIFDPAQRHF